MSCSPQNYPPCVEKCKAKPFYLCNNQELADSIASSTTIPTTTALFTEVVISVSNAGNITAGLQSYTIINIGLVNGTVNGQTLPPGVRLDFVAYLDPVTNEYKRPSGLPYDATGTTFLIVEIP